MLGPDPCDSRVRRQGRNRGHRNTHAVFCRSVRRFGNGNGGPTPWRCGLAKTLEHRTCHARACWRHIVWFYLQEKEAESPSRVGLSFSMLTVAGISSSAAKAALFQALYEEGPGLRELVEIRLILCTDTSRRTIYHVRSYHIMQQCTYDPISCKILVSPHIEQHTI